MSEQAEFDFDRANDQAWQGFRRWLGDQISAMGDGDHLVIQLAGIAEGDGAAPYVRFDADGGRIRCEVSGNAGLAPGFAVDESGERLLTALGWETPADQSGQESATEPPGHRIDLAPAYADRLAVMTVRAFREVWSVAHPSFLTVEPPAPPVAPERAAPAICSPQDADDLQRLVDETLTPVFGHPPVRDADGDIPVWIGEAVMYVRVRRDMPVVEIVAPLVRDLAGRTRAAEVVGDLNRRSTLVKYLLVDDSVFAVVTLPAMPFVPAHLADALQLVWGVVEDADEPFAARLSGRRADADTDPGELAPELVTLMHLDPEGEGSVDAATAARVCRHDADLIRHLLRRASEEEISWRTRGDQAEATGDHDEFAAARHEAAGWAQTVETLRAALRVVVSAPDSERAAKPADGQPPTSAGQGGAET